MAAGVRPVAALLHLSGLLAASSEAFFQEEGGTATASSGWFHLAKVQGNLDQ